MDSGRTPTLGRPGTRPSTRPAPRLLAALAFALAILLGACSAPTLPRLPSLAGPPSPAGRSGSVQAFVPQAVRFVQARRGLAFKHPVKVQELGDAAFVRRVVAVQRRDRSDTRRQAQVLRALGLVPAGVDVERAEEQLVGDAVVGYYDPKTKELAVRGTAATPEVRHVVVHELTHALQDQWFDLAGHQRSLDDDASAAYSALVEGDAVRVEREYVATLSDADQRQISAGEAGGAPPASIPRALVQELAFPYAVGPPFVQAVLQAGGEAALDQAFLKPPAATSLVIHPDRYLSGEAPQAVADPPADGTPFDHGSIGELGLDLLLQGTVQSGALTAGQASTALQSWSGDRYVAWTSGSRSCVRARFAVPASGAAPLATALQRWASRHPGASATPGSASGEGPTLTSCG